MKRCCYYNCVDELAEACASGDHKGLALIVEAHEDSPGTWYAGCAEIAAVHGHLTVLREIAAQPVLMKDGYTTFDRALEAAVLSDHFGITRYLCEEHAEYSRRRAGWALVLACGLSHGEPHARLLLRSFGARLDETFLQDAFLRACETGHLGSIRLFLGEEEEEGDEYLLPDKYIRRGLDWAARNGHDQARQYIARVLEIDWTGSKNVLRT